MEEIKVYNTLTKEKEVFKPITPGEVKIYVCGVTPYNHPHIGNARPAVTWDIIRRYLEYIGYKVKFVQNFTDVDDKIINKANAEGTDWKTISDRYIDAYFKGAKSPGFLFSSLTSMRAPASISSTFLPDNLP